MMFNSFLYNGIRTPIYYHKTDSGAEYLSDTYIECRNAHREGTFSKDTKILLRIDRNEIEIIKI